MQARVAHLSSARKFLALVTPIALLAALPLVHFWFQEAKNENLIILWLGVGFATASAKNILDQQFLIANGDYLRAALGYLITPIITLVAILLSAVTSTFTLQSALLIVAVAPVATTLFGFFLTKNATRNTARKVTALGVARASAPFMFVLFAEALVNRFDQALAFPVLGAKEAGIYSVAALIGVIPLQVSYSISNSALLGMRDGSLVKSAQELARLGLVIPIVTVPVLSVGSYILIPLIFGEEFRGAIPVTSISLVAGSIASVNLVASQSLILSGSGRRLKNAPLLGLGLGLASMLALGPSFGAIGAALASTIGYATTFLAMLGRQAFSTKLLAVKGEDFLTIARLLGIRGGAGK